MTELNVTESVEEIVGQDNIEEIACEPVVTPKKVKVVTRPVEELDNLNVKHMTEPELKKYVEYLRNELVVAVNSVENLRNTTESAFSKCRLLEQQLDNYRASAQQKLLFVQRSVANLNDAIRLVGIQEEK